VNKRTALTISYNLKKYIIIEEKKKSPPHRRHKKRRSLESALKEDHSLQEDVHLSWDGASGYTV